MPEEGRSNEPLPAVPTATSTALQLRRETGLSTLLYPSEEPATVDEDAIHFRDVWRLIVKRKWSIVAFFVIVVVATAIGTLIQTPIYRAEILLKIEPDASKVIPFGNAIQYDIADPDFFQTQLELIKSRALAERVVEEMKLIPAR